MKAKVLNTLAIKQQSSSRKSRGRQPWLCVKCKKPAQMHSHGKRTGTYSVYCLNHLLEQRKRNRDRTQLNRWIQGGGDPAAWMAVAAWKDEKLNGYVREFNKNGFAPQRKKPKIKVKS